MEFQDKCPNCGHPREEGASFCSNCGKPSAESRSGEPQPPPPPPVPPVPDSQAQAEEPQEPKYVPWEDRQNVGFFGGLWETWKESLFGPEVFFSKLPYRGGIGNPLLYALIVAWIGLAVEQIWSVLFSGLMYDMFSRMIPQSELYWATGMQTGLSFLYITFVAPILIIMGMFIVSGLYHLIMMIFGWAKRDFEATFRVVAYSHGPFLFYIIPMCGGFIGIIWSIVLTIIGFKHMQKTSGGKAALTVFLPFILCCCLVAVLFIIFGAAITGFIQQNMGDGYYYN